MNGKREKETSWRLKLHYLYIFSIILSKIEVLLWHLKRIYFLSVKKFSFSYWLRFTKKKKKSSGRWVVYRYTESQNNHFPCPPHPPTFSFMGYSALTAYILHLKSNPLFMASQWLLWRLLRCTKPKVMSSSLDWAVVSHEVFLKDLGILKKKKNKTREHILKTN